MQNKNFYRAFEDKHRGSRELIKERVSVYLPFVLPFKEIYNDTTALDIGCGRGEWLELLKDNHILSKGIDLDEGMLTACSSLNLDVLQGNGISYLKEQADETIAIISAFHVVEHISFEELQSLVKEAFRVLKQGGILILETPNPENIKVATENFYLDPTHIKPIPSNLLSFLPQFYGYFRTKVVRLQESKELANQETINLLEVFEGVSPDYAIIAQKKANEEVLSKFNTAFLKDYGLPLVSLTQRFENRLSKIEAKANEAEFKANEAEAKANEAEAKANEAEFKANEAEFKANEAEFKANEAEARTLSTINSYNSVIHSKSWKLTKPLRLLGKLIRWFFIIIAQFSFIKNFKKILKFIFIYIKNYINKNQTLRTKIIKILNYFPALKAKLKRLDAKDVKNTNINELSARGNEIYSNMQQKINKLSKEIS